ncbi:MAG: 4Fe-4S dicluster domain-containing protein [Armatimonadetes bacterium]|nr:4Fe-4S dicluster domain-containing protein [Armatimonadota bacterium]
MVDYDRFLDCVHCGLCLSQCPTYVELGTEMDSPRGRIYLMRALADGRVEAGASLVSHLDLCLGCRACETACPSGVRYGSLIEATRAELEIRYSRPPADRWFRRFVIERILPYPPRMAAALAPARLGKKLGIFRLAEAVGLGHLFKGLAELLPEEPVRIGPLPERTLARGEKKLTVALLSGCVMSVMFQETNRATIRVLVANGCEALVPKGQGCCGALSLHNGFPEDARRFAKKNIEVFEAAGVDRIVTNAAGCGAAMKEYDHLLAGEPGWAERASRFAAKVRDVSEVLAEVGIEGPLKEIRAKVTYHDACHLAHGQKVRQQPRAILKAIPGLEFVELKESDWCCGSAGTYNLTEPQMAERILKRKLDNILATGASIVVTGNPGCLVQIRNGLRKIGADIEVLHPVELLDRAYGNGGERRS